MPTKSSDINLLKAKTLLTPEMVALEEQLRKGSLIFLGLLLVVGLFFGVWYLILRQKYDGLSQRKQDAKTAIAGEIRKEGLLMSIKDRLVLAKKILDIEETWPPVFGLTARIMGSKNTSFFINDARSISLSIKSDSLEEAFTVVDQVLNEANAKTLVNPTLDGVQYQNDGIIHLSLTFTPTFRSSASE